MKPLFNYHLLALLYNFYYVSMFAFSSLTFRASPLLILYKEYLFPCVLINPQICRHLTYAGNYRILSTTFQAAQSCCYHAPEA
jgi:hypothetical protein